MFGSFVLQVPTSEGFTGGVFTVSHQGVTKSFDCSIGSDSAFQAVSFYADCDHTIHPITKGKRVCLVYNLVATAPEVTTIPSQDVNVDTENKLREIYNDWMNEGPKVTKLGNQLEHEYSHQSLGVSSLKGRDEVVFSTLRNAKKSNGDRLFKVSLLLKERYSEVDYIGDYRDVEDKPAKLIEEKEDGTYETRQLESDDREWNMECYSDKGWWVMEKEHSKYGGVVVDIGDNNDAIVSDSNEGMEDEEGNEYMEEEDEDMEDQEGNAFQRHEHMFLSTYEYKKKENSYNGNDGGQHEAWYFSAAIVLSPQQQ